MIPDFVVEPLAAHRLLPPGTHKATVADTHARFVDGFGSARRQEVFAGWQAFRGLVRQVVPVQQEFVDGSFVTDKDEPKDVDVSFWIAADDLLTLPADAQQAFRLLFGDRDFQRSFNCDAYVVPVCPSGHTNYGDFQHMLWTSEYWAACRDKTGAVVPGVTKGYIEVIA